MEPEIQVMRIKMNFTKLSCPDCVHVVNDPEFLLERGSGKYTIKCLHCSSDMIYMTMKDGYLEKLEDANEKDRTETFKNLIEVIW